jgi:Pyruvate/2-oxoacid:ferredoxin oxidoreductase delta subunit
MSANRDREKARRAYYTQQQAARRVVLKQLNACGECTAYCTALAVSDLEKPMNSPCKYEMHGKGCSIYTLPQRPAECASYQCLWRQANAKGAAEAHNRPDVLGVIFDIGLHGITEGIPTITAREVIPGALESQKVQLMIELFAKEGAVVLIGLKNKRSIKAPPHIIEQVAKRMRERAGAAGAAEEAIDTLKQRIDNITTSVDRLCL